MSPTLRVFFTVRISLVAGSRVPVHGGDDVTLLYALCRSVRFLFDCRDIKPGGQIIVARDVLRYRADSDAYRRASTHLAVLHQRTATAAIVDDGIAKPMPSMLE